MLTFFIDRFIVAGLSPKALSTLFPQFIDFKANITTQFLILMLTYISLDFLTLIIYVHMAKKIAKWLKSNPKTLNIIPGSALIIIAFTKV